MCLALINDAYQMNSYVFAVVKILVVVEAYGYHFDYSVLIHLTDVGHCDLNISTFIINIYCVGRQKNISSY